MTNPDTLFNLVQKLLNFCTNDTKKRLPFITIDRPGHSRRYETEYTF